MRILIYLKIVGIIPKLFHFSKTKIQRVTKTSKAHYRNFSHRFPIYYIFDSFSVNMFDQNYTSECHFLTGLWKVFTKLMIRHRFRWRQTAATTCSSIPLKSKCYYYEKGLLVVYYLSFPVSLWFSTTLLSYFFNPLLWW